jgi:hypothetical protein
MVSLKDRLLLTQAQFSQYHLWEGLNKNINKNGGILHGEGSQPIQQKLLILYQKIKTPQTDPNAPSLENSIHYINFFI